MAQSADLLVTRMSLKIEQRVSFFDKTSKELNTPEGRALIEAIKKVIEVIISDGGDGSGGGSRLNSTGAAGMTASSVRAKALKVTGRVEGEAYYYDVYPPKGYTICAARVSYPKSTYRGIESSRDSTFNATIGRPRRGGGLLGLYLVVPRHSYTTRAMGTFDVIFVKTSLWRNKAVKCQLNGFHPWLSRNNQTRLNVKG
jgi:hypothetical protein